MVNDATREGFRLSYGRGRSLSVILPSTMIAYTKDSLIGCLAATLLSIPGDWSKAKEQMRQHLEHLTRTHVRNCPLYVHTTSSRTVALQHLRL